MAFTGEGSPCAFSHAGNRIFKVRGFKVIKVFNKKVKNIHFVGIGGSGMSGIAEVLLNLGYNVSGSDAKETDITRRLAGMGSRVFIGHRASQINGSHVVVMSSAINSGNVEIVRARELEIPVIPRAEMLAELARLKYAVTIAGTHGKTTTTSLVSLVLQAAGLDPTVIIGGRLKNIESHAKLGQGEYLVAEADESDGSFLKLSPAIAVITNIDNDHMDFYQTEERLHDAFIQYANRVPFYGAVILCEDDKGVSLVKDRITRRRLSYGFSEKADVRAVNPLANGNAGHPCCDVFFKGVKLGELRLKVPGRHNLQNALAGVAVGLELDIDFGTIAVALEKFQGVGRRCEIKGESNGVLVIDDYGHHPTEIKATIDAIKNAWPGRRLVVLFQPHRYTRTQSLWREFGPALKAAEGVFILPVYPAGETPIPGVGSNLIVNAAREAGITAEYADTSAVIQILSKELKPGDVLLTLGAGDVWKIGESFLTGGVK